jgi:hypothetical protein
LLAFLAYTGCDKVTAPEPDEHQVPEVVIKAIVEEFLDATNLSLITVPTDAFYAADFWVQNKHYQAIINQDGSFQALNLERPIAALPLNGLDFVTQQFNRIEQADQLVKTRLYTLGLGIQTTF